MRFVAIILFVLFPLLLSAQKSFETEQKRYSRVRTAYSEKYDIIQSLLEEKNISNSDFSIYMRSFKEEQELELWIKSAENSKYQLLKVYSICSNSGVIGPKRQQGDYQVPEGFYRVDRFNPYSNFYLSLGINYPNKSDKILGVSGKLGGDIFIHGDCVTIGCIPITDEQIKELYVICVEASKVGQKSIPITIFPKRLTQSNFESLQKQYKDDEDKLSLWSDLKNGFDLFNKNKKLPSVSFLANGKHLVR